MLSLGLLRVFGGFSRRGSKPERSAEETRRHRQQLLPERPRGVWRPGAQTSHSSPDPRIGCLQVAVDTMLGGGPVPFDGGWAENWVETRQAAAARLERFLQFAFAPRNGPEAPRTKAPISQHTGTFDPTHFLNQMAASVGRSRVGAPGRFEAGSGLIEAIRCQSPKSAGSATRKIQRRRSSGPEKGAKGHQGEAKL